MEASGETLASLGIASADIGSMMTQNDYALVTVGQDGSQWTLRFMDAPDGFAGQDYWTLSGEERAALLDTLAASENAEVLWDWHAATGLALLSQQTATQSAAGIPAMQMTTLTAVTLHQGRLVLISREVIGREVSDRDMEDIMDGIGRRLVFLQASGVADEAAAPLTLGTENAEMAEVTVESGDLALVLDPIAKNLASTTLILSGTTEKSAAMRYSVNGKSSSRFYSKDDGSFRVTAPTLQNGMDNEIVLTVMGDGKNAPQGVVSLTVHVERDQPPVAIGLKQYATTEESISFSGLTVPGAKVTLGKKTKGSTITANKAAGTFDITMKLPNMGENTVTLALSAAGYSNGTYPVTVLRLPADSAELQSLIATTESLPAAQLSGSDSVGRLTSLRGTVSDLCSAYGTGYFMLRDEAGSEYAIETSDLTDIHMDSSFSLLALATGQTSNVLGDTVPLLRLLAVAANP